MRKPVRRTSKQDRQLVPVLLEAYLGDRNQTAEHLGRSLRFVDRWAARYKAGAGFGNAPGCGRKRMISGRGISAAKRMATAKIPRSAKTIAAALKKSKFTKTQANPTTVLRWLKTGRSPVRFLPLVRNHRITAVHKQKRLKWARQNRTIDWDCVLFTDSHIYQAGGTTGRKRQQRVNARKRRQTQAHGLKLHVYAGMSARGVTELRFVTGTSGIHFTSPRTGKICVGLQAEEYCNVIRDNFIPGGRMLFGNSEFTVYQDGAPAHTARLTRTFWSEYPSTEVLQAPPLSPDLNLIENLWGILDNYLDAREFKCMKALKSAATKAWHGITEATCKKLVEGMPKRLRKVIACRGDHIERNIYS